MKFENILKLFITHNPQVGGKDSQPSYLKNVGKISCTWQDSGIYGRFMNTCRLEAWKYAITHFDIDQTSILDVGCSYGSWAQNYRTLGFKKLLGLDPNPTAVEEAVKVFDECHVGSAKDLRDIYPQAHTVGANGVVVHIMEEDETIQFLKDVKHILPEKGVFLFSIVNARWYYSGGRREMRADLSTVRFLERWREFCQVAGLRILGEVGTFIDPWALPDLDFFAQETQLREEWALYQVFIDLAGLIRGQRVDPFSEVLLVTRRQE